MKKKIQKKNLYKIKNIENFLPAYCDYITPKGDKGYDELYYSISSYDSVRDISNLDYIGFWKEKTCWGDECGYGECLSSNKPFYHKVRKDIKKRKNNILTMFPGEDSRNPSISKIYYNKILSKFYFNFSIMSESTSLIRKASELKNKKIFDKFTVKNNKIVIFCLAYLNFNLKEYFPDLFIKNILKKNYGYSYKALKEENYRTDDYNSATKDFLKKKIEFTEKNLINLTPKDKKELLGYAADDISKNYIFDVPNGEYIVSLITHEDLYGEHNPGTFNPLGYLVELKK